MKKTLLLCSFVLSVIFCRAQSFVLSSYNISIVGDNDSLLHASAVVHNISGNTLDVRGERTVENLAPGHLSYFCWGNFCYAPAQSLSTFTTTLAPGDSSVTGPAGFIAYLNPNGLVGASDITYCFYDDLNPSDSICITFNYDAIVTGIRELIASGIILTNPLPNPAGAYAQIGVNASSMKNARLVFYNMLGSVIKELKLGEKQNLVTVSTADFKNGIYLYSLIADDKLVASKKLIVNHR